MSAIFGIIDIKGQKNIGELNTDKILKTYEDKCVLDKISEIKNEHVYMGLGLQAVTYESKFEKMPIEDTKRNVYFVADIVLNNREELIAETGAAFDTSDGELAYRAYCKWGLKFPEHMLGQFAIVIYEASAGKIHLISDHIASRCLYYGIIDGKFVFSTLLEPLKACFKLKVNENYVKDYLVAPYLMPCFSDTETYYEGLSKLSTAEVVSYADKELTKKVYWDPRKIKRPVFHKGARSLGKEFVSIYEKCVLDVLRTDGNMGISMSSGLDSSSIGALAARNLAKENKKLFTYTYVPGSLMQEERNKNIVFNETNDVLGICKMYPNMVPHFVNNEDRNSVMELEKVLDFMEFPIKAFVNFPNLYEIMKKAHTDNECKVVLTGQGGNMNVSMGKPDDIQYDLYLKKRYLRLFLNLNRFCKKTGLSRRQNFKGLIGDYKRYTKLVKNCSHSDIEIYNPFVLKTILDDYNIYERCPEIGRFGLPVHYLAGHEYMKYNFNIPSLVYIGEYETKLGLATGVMIRDATRDKRIFEFCAKLPYEYFCHKGTPRWLINGNFSEILPDYIINNWTRYGFQNADFIERVNRDKEAIIKYLREILKSADRYQFLAKDTILEYLDSIEGKSVIEDENELSFLIYVCIVLLCETKNI